MRTTQNIEQVFSKISNFLIDVRYWLLRNDFYYLPEIGDIKNESYIPNSILSKYYSWNTYFDNKKTKNEYVQSVNKLLNFNLIENNVNILKILSFLEYYIFEKEIFGQNRENEERNKISLWKAIDQISVENEKIIIHMLEIDGKYIPFTNVFALCCYILICLDKQGYKLNYWNINSENKEIWEQICNKIIKNKFVFKIYNSQEEINQKFYKKYLLTDDQNYGVNYGVFANIASNIFKRQNTSSKSRVFRELDMTKKYNNFTLNESIFKYVFNKSKTYEAIKEKFLLSFMFDDETITKLPKYAFKIDYWKSFFEKIGNLLPFNIPEEKLKFNIQLKTSRYESFSGYINLVWISEKNLIHNKENCKVNLGILVNEKLINENIDITDKTFERLLSIDVINIPKLISKYGIDYKKIRSCSNIIATEIKKFYSNSRNYKIINEYM